MMKITGKTTVCGIIGDPVEHTLSPAMQNAAFQALGLDWVYVPYHVTEEDLPAAIYGMRSLGIRGLNVTIPHKVEVLPLLDSLDKLAEQIGAVNTVINRDGKLTGYNTDAFGFLQALAGNGVEIEGKNIVVMGAGGAARAAAMALGGKGANLIVINRTAKTATELVARVSYFLPGARIMALEMNEENLRAVAGDSQIIINTTSMGMNPYANNSPMPAHLIQPHHTVFDVVYSPLKTKLLRDAEMGGAKTINGLDMLVWQGGAAFEIWTGKKAPIDAMKLALIEAFVEK